jgi:hypothetical protein
MDPKYAITTDKERLIIGADVIQLKDQSSETFNTDYFSDFVRFITKVKSNNDTVFYNERGAILMPAVFEDPRHTNPLAKVTIATHPRLEALLNVNGKSMGLDTIENLLRRLKGNLNPDGLELLNNVADFKVAKVQKIERKKERNGNYKFNVSRESAGSGDFIPPETVRFRVPIFQGLVETVTIEMEFRFEFKDTGDSVRLEFTLENLNIDEVILEARKTALWKSLNEAGVTAYWGGLVKNLQTDAWQYQRNAVEG